MFVAACLAAHGYWHLGKRFKNDGVGVEPGRNRLVRTWTSSEDRRHAAAFYGAVQRYSSLSKSDVNILVSLNQPASDAILRTVTSSFDFWDKLSPS